MFLDMGYSLSLFWDSSLKEVYDLIDSYNRRKTNDAKEKISLNNFLANRICDCINSMFKKDSKTFNVWDYYPELFKDEKAKHEEQQSKADLELYKAKFKEFTNFHNSKMKGGN